MDHLKTLQGQRFDDFHALSAAIAREDVKRAKNLTSTKAARRANRERNLAKKRAKRAA